MTNKDKIIATFLVSMGIFSAVQAVEYVVSLDGKEKEVMLSAASAKDSNVFLCSTSTFPQDVETKPNSKA